MDSEPITGAGAFPGASFYYIRGEVVHMTSAEIILIFIGIVGLMVSFGSLIVAVLTFLEKRKKHKK